MTATLGRDLVFDMNRGDAGALEFTHRAHEIDGIAVAGVRVGDNGNLYRGNDLGGTVDGFRQRDQADIRYAHASRHRATAQIRRFKSRLFDETGREAVEATRGN